MKAIALRRYGAPDVLQLEEMAKPQPKAGEVLIKVQATSVNDWDWCFVRGKPHIYRLMFGLRRPKVAVLGAEVAGVVEALGEGAGKFSVGDAVYGDISEAGFGGFAEYVAVDERALARMPSGMTFEQAAAIPHAAMLALQGLVDVGQIQQGERVLINGAGGGVGTIGLQIAKKYGAQVTGVDSAAKQSAMVDLGFDQVIDYTQEDFTRRGERYDLILDTKTTRSVFSYLRALNPGGRYVTVGGRLPRIFQVFCLAPMIARTHKKKVAVVALKPNKDLESMNELFEERGLRCLIDGPYSLGEVPRALRRFGEAKHVGKVVIAVGA